MNPKEFFFDLTPDRVLDSVEASGLRCTGRCMALNSFENRVYDVELETEPVQRRIVKFYRPGRWTREQILEEHLFLKDLEAAEIPAVAPLLFPDGQTLKKLKHTEIEYALFPKVGGRSPDELSDEQLLRVGRLLARIHNVGSTREAPHRLRITPESYGLDNLEFLLKNQWIPLELMGRYKSAVEKIAEITQKLFKNVKFQRIHGDCHLGNLLWNSSGPFFVDFDDMLNGPEVQDVWLLVPGRDNEARRQRDQLLQGYQEMRPFDLSTLRLIEPLRSLRMIHYSTWLARRWEDPAFPIAFPQFNTYDYWRDETESLEKQLQWMVAS